MRRSIERAARNEAAFREANEHLAEKAGHLSASRERAPYLCECEEETCTQVIRLTRQEYEAVRSDPKRFVVVRGHQGADDDVVQDGARFTIIEKTGEEGELVAERNPRTAP